MIYNVCDIGWMERAVVSAWETLNVGHMAVRGKQKEGRNVVVLGVTKGKICSEEVF